MVITSGMLALFLSGWAVYNCWKSQKDLDEFMQSQAKHREELRSMIESLRVDVDWVERSVRDLEEQSLNTN